MHVEVGDEVDDAHGPRNERYVLELGAGPRDDAQQRLHHAAGDQRLAARLVARQVVQEREERRGQRQGERRRRSLRNRANSSSNRSRRAR